MHRTTPAIGLPGLFRVALLATLAACARGRVGPPPPVGDIDRADLAVSGEGAPHYRIPAMTVTTRGTVLAAYDRRTWSPPITVRRDTIPLSFGDPSLLVDRDTRRIFLFHAAGVHQGFFGSRVGNDEQDEQVLQVDLSYSDDDGLTWRHRRLTRRIKDPTWSALFAASGEGIQLRHGPHAGRLVQQYVVRTAGNNWAASAYSDDHGETWRMGALVGPGADENRVVELADGRLMPNSRAKPHRRMIQESAGSSSATPSMRACAAISW